MGGGEMHEGAEMPMRKEEAKAEEGVLFMNTSESTTSSAKHHIKIKSK